MTEWRIQEDPEPTFDTPVAWMCGWGETRWCVWTKTIEEARQMARQHSGNVTPWVRLATRNEAEEWRE